MAVLNGCGTADNMVKTQATAQDAPNPQTQDFSPWGDVSQSENGIHVTLSGDSLFKIGRSHLSPDGVRKIDAIAAALLKHPGDRVTVLEYTDNTGSDVRNLKLSQRRADALKGELVKQGVPLDKVTAVGKGDADPLVGNDTAENRSKNRRVVLEITTSSAAAGDSKNAFHDWG
jgi:outer membrane protein OmpA-like peptidoglycan-associated protein